MFSHRSDVSTSLDQSSLIMNNDGDDDDDVRLTLFSTFLFLQKVGAPMPKNGRRLPVFFFFFSFLVHNDFFIFFFHG
jgi:hypothetical protein